MRNLRQPVRILLMTEDPACANRLEEDFLALGHQVVARLNIHEDMHRALADNTPDVVVLDMASPNRDVLEQMGRMEQNQSRPVLVFTQNDDLDVIRAAIKAGVSAYVVDGLGRHRIMPILEAAIARFEQTQALKAELESTKTALAERKTIEKAKGLLMKNRGWDEPHAYQAMRKLAMDKNQKLVDVAQQLLTWEEIGS